MIQGMITGLVGLAAVFSYAATWLARVVAPRLRILDHPDGQRKLHAQATPLMGGVAVFLAIIATTILASIFTVESNSFLERHALLLACAALICLIGLWDDIHPLDARTKIVLQSAPIVIYAVFGQSIEEVGAFGISFPLEVFAIPATMVWLILCVSAFNLVDGADGVASSQGGIALTALGIIALADLSTDLAAISFIVAGSLVGFLAHNRPPAKIFLGDAGSCTIGFLFGAIAIHVSQHASQGYLGPIVVVVAGIPFLDTAFAITRRALMGNGIMTSDRGHIHHCFGDRGLSKWQTLLSLSGIAIVFAATAVFTSISDNDWIAIGASAVVLVVLILSRAFGHRELQLIMGRLHEQATSRGVRRRLKELRIASAEQSDKSEPTVVLFTDEITDSLTESRRHSGDKTQRAA